MLTTRLHHYSKVTGLNIYRTRRAQEEATQKEIEKESKKGSESRYEKKEKLTESRKRDTVY